MATIRQQKVFKAVVKGSTISGAMVKAGYSKTTAHRTNKVTRTKGWQELLKQHLPDSALAKRHRELLNKQETRTNADGDVIDLGLDTQAVSKALDMAYKLKGAYAPEKSLNVNIEIPISPKLKELAEILNEN